MERMIDRIHGLLWEEKGFSTVGVALALLVTLSLIFTAAKVYDVDSASANVQEVSDASVMAAENMVGEYYVVAEVCDAVTLSLSLSSVACLGLSVVTAIIPGASAFSKPLLQASKQLGKTRNSFAKKAVKGLDKLQKALPFIALAKGYQVMAANNAKDEARYLGVVVLSPQKGEDLSDLTFGEADKAQGEADERLGDLEEAGDEAEKATEEANKWKEIAYEADCGTSSAHSMYERAKKLVGLGGSKNQFYASVDTWNFQVALKRSQAYYAKRLDEESPDGSSAKDRGNSALRKRFYKYAVAELDKGYVRETETSFSANFPLLFKNTKEMKDTKLYRESVYPITINEDGTKTMHAWSGCPGIDGAQHGGKGSIKELDSWSSASCAKCERCEFTVSSMGKVASATTNIETGYEYYYRIVAEAAEAYEKAKNKALEASGEAKDIASGLFDAIKRALKEAVGQRIKVFPPGRYGAVCLTVDTSSHAPSSLFSSSFVESTGVLGPRAAVSSACLVKEESDEGNDVISTFLSGYAREGGPGLGALDVAAGLWSALLEGYASGQEAFVGAVRGALDEFPLTSASGLGDWAAGVFEEGLDDLGLEAPDLRAAKAALVNSSHVLEADDSAFSARLLSAKRLAFSGGDGTLFSAALSALERRALSSVGGLSGEVEIGSIQVVEGGVSIPITIALPGFVKDVAGGLVSTACSALSGLVSGVVYGGRWE